MNFFQNSRKIISLTCFQREKIMKFLFHMLHVLHSYIVTHDTHAPAYTKIFTVTYNELHEFFIAIRFGAKKGVFQTWSQNTISDNIKSVFSVQKQSLSHVICRNSEYQIQAKKLKHMFLFFALLLNYTL